MRVWFSGKTTAFQAVVGGSIPLTHPTNIKAVLWDGFYIVVVRSEEKRGTLFVRNRKGCQLF